MGNKEIIAKGGYIMRKSFKGVIAKACALSLVVATAFSFTVAPSSDAKAAKPKLSKKTVSVKVKKSTKLTIKGKKIKNTKWTVKSSKIAKLSAKKKTSVKITGKKAGKTTVTAKFKAGSKKYTLKATVKVTDTGKKTVQSSTAPATKEPAKATNTPTPALKPTDTPAPAGPTPLVDYSEDFENGLGLWYARFNEEDEAQKDCKLVSYDGEAHSGKKSMLITGRGSSWNSCGMDINEAITYGEAKYTVSFWCKSPNIEGDKFGTKKAPLKVILSTGNWVEGEETYYNWPADFSNPVYKTKADADASGALDPSGKPYETDENGWTHIVTTFTTQAVGEKFLIYVETNGCGKASILIDDFTIHRDFAPRDYDKNEKSLKDAYSKYFDHFGCAFTYYNLLSEQFLGFAKKHFNSVTLGNEFKLDSIIGNPEDAAEGKGCGILLDQPKPEDVGEDGVVYDTSDYVVSDEYKAMPDNLDENGKVLVPYINFKRLDNTLKIAKENGLQIRLHAPFWHQQNAAQFFTKGYLYYPCKKDDAGKDVVPAEKYTDKETMYAREQMFVQTILNHIYKTGYGDVVYAYDVVNEYTHMDNEGVYTNQWKFAFGTEMKTNQEYVKRAYVYAYDQLKKMGHEKDMSLIYNDYSTYMGDTAEKIIELIDYINTKDDINTTGDKVCAGIGMQCHIGETAWTKDLFETTVKKFAAKNYEIQITELDVTNCGTVNDDTTEDAKAKVWSDSAKVYTDLMKVLLDQKKAGANISSVTIWGSTDASSWRKDRAPVLFGSDLADKKPAFDALINLAETYK